MILRGVLAGSFDNHQLLRALADGDGVAYADLKGRNGSISLPIAGAAKGIYVVRVMMEQGMQAQKITIQ